MRIPLTYKVTFIFSRIPGDSGLHIYHLPKKTLDKFKLTRAASHTNWPDKRDSLAFEATLEPSELLELFKLTHATIDAQERVFGDLPRQAARYTSDDYKLCSGFLDNFEVYTLQVQALMDTDTVRDTADRNYDLVGFEDAMVWGSIYVPKAVEEIETILRTLTLPNGVTLCYRGYYGGTNSVNNDNPENFQFPTHVGLEGVGQKFLFPLEENPNKVLAEVTDETTPPTTHLPIHDVNGVEIKEGMKVRTQQPSGGVLPPSPPKTGIVEAAVDAFGIPTLQIVYCSDGTGYCGCILLQGKINEVLPS